MADNFSMRLIFALNSFTLLQVTVDVVFHY